MSTSKFIQINNFVLLEYVYEDNTNSFSNTSVGCQILTNTYTNERLFLNYNTAIQKTKNTLDVNAYENINIRNRWNYLDIDAPNPFLGQDPNITLTDVSSLLASSSIRYDKVRIHFVSGYNFENIEGFILKIFIKDDSGNNFNLSHRVFRKNEHALEFNDAPLLINERSYDRFLEIQIPSTSFIITEQQLNSNLPNITSKVFTGNTKGIDLNTLIYIGYFEITNQIYNNGNITFETDNFSEKLLISINPADQYSLIGANIIENKEFNYVEYYATFDNKFISEFINFQYLLGVQFYVYHTLELYEQVGTSLIRSFIFTNFQEHDFDKPMLFRPVLVYSPYTSSFTIKYTMKLINKMNGETIFRTSSLTSTNVSPYGKKLNVISTGKTLHNLKIYNKNITTSDTVEIKNFFSDISNPIKENIKTKYLFVNQNDILINKEDDAQVSFISNIELKNSFFYKNGELKLDLNEFDNIIKFKISKINGDSIEILNLEGLDVLFSFIFDDGNKIYVENNKEFSDLKNGIITFIIKGDLSNKIKNQKNKKFYLISKGLDGIENVLYWSFIN
jgi:hypothetical protein